MKKLYLFVSLCVITTFLNAQTIAITAQGRKVLLFPNGSWRYTDSNFKQDNFSVDSLYNEAYDYAYDLLYGDEFFTTERKNKSIEYAVDYVKSNLSIPVGFKTFEQWYDELYAFAYSRLGKDSWAFNPDRKKMATEWTSQAIKDKGYFDDYRLSYIARQRLAYNFAYNKIYSTEMFQQDRRKKSLQWASDFVKR